MVNSAAYPGLERKPGGPDNWVERAGGLPKYIERIAKHLHYERGYSISRAIATAVNTVKRWAHMGKVAKYGDPNHKHVSAKTAAQAAAAVAEWEAKKAAGKIHLSDVEGFIIDLTGISREFAIDLADELEGVDLSTYDRRGTSADPTRHAILAAMDVKALAKRANQIEDPELRASARQRVLEMTFGEGTVIDLASTIAPRNARGKAKDGRRSYKGQGKFKHGFIPVNQAAKEAKAKGSPIAIKRLNRIFGGNKAPDDPRANVRGPKTPPPPLPQKSKNEKAAVGTAGSRSAGGRKNNAKDVSIDEKSQPGSEQAKSLGALVHTKFSTRDQDTKAKLPEGQKEASKSSRIPPRAKQNWDEIPDNLKTMRNGERYVYAEYGGKGFVTKWVGGVHDAPGDTNRVVTSITSSDAAKLPPSEQQRILNDPRTPPRVKARIRRVTKSGAR